MRDEPTDAGEGAVLKRLRKEAAVFVEKNESATASRPERAQQSPVTTTPVEASGADGAAATTEPEEPVTPSQPRRKPGRQSKTGPKQPLPSTLRPQLNDQALDMRTAQMTGWTRDATGVNQVDVASETQTSPSRYRPKVPAKRFFERHPELDKQLNEKFGIRPEDAREKVDGSTRDETPADLTDSSDSGDGWIVDEYERLPAAKVVAEAVDPDAIGVLVIETEQDDQIFYAEGKGLEDEMTGDDDVDENGESKACPIRFPLSSWGTKP